MIEISFDPVIKFYFRKLNFIKRQFRGNYDFTSPYDRRLLMMRVLEGVNAKTDMAEDVDQVVGLGGRTLIILRYALGPRLRKD